MNILNSILFYLILFYSVLINHDSLMITINLANKYQITNYIDAGKHIRINENDLFDNMKNIQNIPKT